jgi:hypothetical protein
MRLSIMIMAGSIVVFPALSGCMPEPKVHVEAPVGQWVRRIERLPIGGGS